MSEFQTPVDIANRALQHLGQRRINVTLGFSEISQNASETNACYGKLRQAELDRNTWYFAIKRQVLRAIDNNTMILSPAVFTASTIYFRGSIVNDSNGNPWISKIANNLGNDPLASTDWDPYFGPLTVSLYDGTQFYYAGEVVYTAPGDGTFNVYLSRISGNSLDPSLPNLWNTAAAYMQNDVVQGYPAWAIGTTYSRGQTVSYTDGNTYSSLTNSNIGNTPSATSTAWATMPTLSLATVPSPSTSPVIEWNATTIYSSGSFVMFDGNEYLSFVANNTGNVPNAAGSTSWVQVTGGTLYMSRINLNIGQNPATTFVAAWLIGTTYSINQKVTGSDGNIYTSVGNGNVGNDPTLDGGVHWTNTGVLSPWSTSFTQGGGNQQWMQIGGAAFPQGVGLTVSSIIYPLGTGPATDNSTANIFRLPAGFMRRAPRDPKAGSQTDLGAPTNLIYDDWNFEGDHIVSRQSDPIVLRFVADVTDVTKMSAMFCEGLAARIAYETCEKLTQSTEKVKVAMEAYDRAMSDARTQNAIIVGSEESPMDDWLAVRY